MSQHPFPTLYATAIVRGEYVRVIAQSATNKLDADLQLLVVLGDGSREWVSAATASPVL